ncbi:MAG: IreB family regulatory phosphoprotein [Firmicutes bacterium]|nr:IreB family regulatory phosphoprotein [Bacillota bacterium]
MADLSESTRMFTAANGDDLDVKSIIRQVYHALKEKGYRPIDQIMGYLMSGDPAYITSHGDARTLIKRVERDELLEEIVRTYLETL